MQTLTPHRPISLSPHLNTVVVTLALAFASPSARADHDPRFSVPEPVSAGEAWATIRQSLDNIDKCLGTRQDAPVGVHVGNCSPALRFLQAQAKQRGDKALWDRLEALYYTGDAIITAVRRKDDPFGKARAALATHREAVNAVAAAYPPEVANAVVFVCVHHPHERTTDAKGRCAKCSMSLVRRRIPYSITWEKPGEPTMKLAVDVPAGRPLEVGKPHAVGLRLTKNDGTPIAHRDLLTVHTEKIHLLIVDGSLTDYHHEHPAPADKPGEYTFMFTPRKPGPYRVFADVVPAETSVQEYVIADVPVAGDPGPVEPRPTGLKSAAGGFTFELKLALRDGAVPAGQPVAGALTVLGPDGQPFKQLEPVMGAFAHLVAFRHDRRTVLHVHPEGPEPDAPERRGGPTLSFKLYAPAPGFYRLYAQVQILGEQVFAPFNITVK